MYKLNISRQELDLEKILNSGQVFRYEKLGKGRYVLIRSTYFVLVESVNDGYIFHCSKESFQKIWYHYLDLDKDYRQANNYITQMNPDLESIIYKYRGMRILAQNPFEMLFTFIVSQSKSIPQIRRLVNSMAKDYGQLIGQVDQVLIYSFPQAEDLRDLTEADYRKRKFGYRGAYLVAAVEGFKAESINYGEDELKLYLRAIHGVGDKVAACVMLYGYGCHGAFPVDTWMRKIMLYLYEEDIRKGIKNPKLKRLSNQHIENYGRHLFGSCSGLAQQYLFEYGRSIF